MAAEAQTDYLHLTREQLTRKVPVNYSGIIEEQVTQGLGFDGTKLGLTNGYTYGDIELQRTIGEMDRVTGQGADHLDYLGAMHRLILAKLDYSNELLSSRILHRRRPVDFPYSPMLLYNVDDRYSSTPYQVQEEVVGYLRGEQSMGGEQKVKQELALRESDRHVRERLQSILLRLQS